MRFRSSARAWWGDHKRAVRWFSGVTYVAVVAAFVLDLVHLEHVNEMAELFLALVGGVFAVLAMEDAHHAFEKAQAVQEAVGSFRFRFEDLLDEMIKQIHGAKASVALLVPTPAYGYLFDQVERSRQLVDAILAACARPNCRVDLCFVWGGDLNATPRHLSPQRYLRRSYQMQLAKGYRELVDRFFRALEAQPEGIRIWLLRSDPNVRILLVDSESETPVSVLSFAPATVEAVGEPFESVGFASTRRDMTDAVQRLWNVYTKETAQEIEASEWLRLEDMFTVLQ